MKNIKVVHPVKFWLPQTMTWLFNQITGMPSEIENHVVCEGVLNLDQFPFSNIHCSENIINQYVKKSARIFGCRWDGFLDKSVRELGPHIIHSHFGNTGWIDSRYTEKYDLKHVVTFYGLDVNRLPTVNPQWKKRYLKLFEVVDMILCEGPFMAKSIVNLGCPKQKVRVHHLGVDVENIKFQPRFWRKGSPLRVLIAASFREKKGIPYAIEALGKLQNDLPLEITIIGDASSEKRSKAEKEKILSLINRCQLKEKTRLLGYQSHSFFFEEAYRNHIFLSPSVTAGDGDTEGGAPVSIIEMAASGMPIFSTFHCDIPNIIQHGKTGFLSPERDTDSLADNIMKAAEDWHLLTPLLLNSRKNIEEQFSIKKQSLNLSQIYKRLL